MANKKISELQSRTPALTDLMLVGDPSSGYSYKCTVTALATIIETDIADGYVTIGTTQTISGAKTFSNNLTLTSVVNTPTDPDKFLTLNASNVVTYRTGAEVLSDIGGQGALTLTTSGSSGAATLVGNTLNIPQYQSVITNPVTGTGVANYITKWASSSSISNSQLYDNGTNVGIGVDANIVAGYLLTIGGKVKFYNQIDLDNPTTNTCNTINIQKGTSISHRGAGYIQIASFNTNRLSLFFNDNNNYQADFDGSNLTTGRRYILPDATGTLALTSDLSSYVPTSRTLTINGTTFDLSANRTWSVGTVTSVGLSTGTTGTDVNVSGSPVTSSGTITLNIPTASATNRGALSSTDWSTFNNKQSAISLTTTGNSGAATFVSNTLNIPNYTLSGLGGISGSGTTNYIPKFTSSSAIGNSIVQDYGDNVWVGTNTSGYGTLNIQRFVSAPYATLTLTDQATPANEVGIYLRSNGSNPVGISSAGAPIAFYTGGPATNEGMRLDASGNLAIGSTTALGKLQISTSSGTTIFRSVVAFGGTANADNLSIKQDFITGVAANYLWSNSNYMLGVGRNGGTMPTTEADAIALSSFVVNSSGNVGIGTTSPGSNLTIQQASTSATLGIRHTASGNGYGWRFATTGTTTNDLIFSNEFNGSFTERMRLDASGNLGLGTTTIGERLTVNGYVGLQRSGTQIWHYGVDANNSLEFVRSGIATRMILSSDGNLGLGVTPSAWGSTFRALQIGRGSLSADGNDNLQFSQNAYYDGSNWKYIASTFANNFYSDGSQFVWRIAPSGTAGNAISFTQAMTLFSTGNLAVGGTSDAGYKLDVTGQIRVKGNTNEQLILDYTTASGGFSWQSFRLNGVNKYRLVGNVDNSFGIYSDILSTYALSIASTGNVGIGTTSPTQLLTLEGADGYLFTVQENGANKSRFQIYQDDGGSSLVAGYNSTATNMYFYTGSSERMRITSGGLVGIGTSNPTSRFAVRGVNSNSQIEFDNFGSGVNYILSIDRVASAYRDIVLITNSSNNTLYAATSGNVGIGTTSPTAKLDITATSSYNALRLNSDAAGTYTILEFANAGTLKSQIYNDLSGGDLVTRTVTSANLIFGTNSSERMRITSGGNVLVGTTTDGGYRLRVNGTSLFGGDAAYNGIYINNNSTTGGGFVAVQQNGNTRGLIAVSGAWLGNTASDMAIIAETGNSLTFFTNGSGSERMRITSSGELLINTTSDAGDYKLQVNGSVYFGTSSTSSIRSYITTNVAGLELQGGVGSGTVGASAYMRLGDVTNEKYIIQQIDNNGHLDYWFYNGSSWSNTMSILQSGNIESSGSIKTAAPSGGTAKPWKLGEAGVTLGGSNTSGVRVEIDGVVYYLVTGYLP